MEKNKPQPAYTYIFNKLMLSLSFDKIRSLALIAAIGKSGNI